MNGGNEGVDGKEVVRAWNAFVVQLLIFSTYTHGNLCLPTQENVANTYHSNRLVPLVASAQRSKAHSRSTNRIPASLAR